MYLVIIGVIIGLAIAWLVCELCRAQPDPAEPQLPDCDFRLELIGFNMPVRLDHLYRVFCPDGQVAQVRWIAALLEINQPFFGEEISDGIVPVGISVFIPDCRPRRLPEFLLRDRSPCEREDEDN